jgi:protein dithiol oxidoreductase (disulfide-forming)
MRNLFGSLLLALSLVAGFAHALAAEPVAGQDYQVLNVTHPTSAPPGKVEVIEFFDCTDYFCYKFEPSIEAFVKKEGDRIVFKRVPAVFGGNVDAASRIYYSLVQLGLEEKLMLTLYNNNALPTLDEQAEADFLATQGVDKRKFIDAYDSDTVTSLMFQGDRLKGDYTIRHLPTVVVAGRYKIERHLNNLAAILTVLDYVVKQVQDKKL